MKEQLKIELKTEDLSYFLSHRVFERIPFIFNNHEEFLKWKDIFSIKIDVDPSAIIFIGSASIGISLNPNKNFKNFDNDSYIDIAIISQFYFDLSWRTLRNLGIKKYNLTPKQKKSLEDHVNRLIYWGTIATDKLLPILPFGSKWMEALEEMKDFSPTKDHQVNLRIYKDFDSLRSYHVNNLKQIKNRLLI
jgi:hypothetical protein